METGQRGIRPGELRKLLTEYGIEDSVQDALAAVGRPHGARGWWRGCSGSLTAACQEFFALEAAAAGVQVWEPQRVPDLLQARDYARALTDVVPGLADDESRQEAVEALAARQQVVLEERRTEMTVIIAERRWDSRSAAWA